MYSDNVFLRWSIAAFILCSTAFASSELSDDGDCSEPTENVWTFSKECDRKDGVWGSFACACTVEHCDLPGIIAGPADENEFVVVTSAKEDKRFEVTSGKLDSIELDESIAVTINPEIKYQKMLGYGGAFTDSAGMAIYSLSPAAQNNFFQSYFSEIGIKYTLGRVPIGGTDFSTKPYAYNEVEGDTKLESFSLADEDFKYKIPYIKRAKETSGGALRLIASAWSPPAWMKDNNKINGTGKLKPELYDVYAKYIVKFLEEYKKEGLEIFGMTSQNEPLAGSLRDWPFNNCLWFAEDMKTWLTDHLGPALETAGYDDLQLIINDQVRNFTYDYTSTILSSPKANKYVDGISMHWYYDFEENKDILTKTGTSFPDKFLLYTEACTGFDSPPEEKVKLGSWDRAEMYAQSLLLSANAKVSGWIDWNIALDMQGGPNWSGNFVDSPILVDKDEDTFYKQPMFYALGHFSKFIVPGSYVVFNNYDSTYSSEVLLTTFKKPDNSGVTILLNKSNKEIPVSIRIGDASKMMNLKMPPKSIQTVLFKYPQLN